MKQEDFPKVEIDVFKPLNPIIDTFLGSDISTHRYSLGFQFLVRNEGKNGIPHEEMRKIRGIFLP